VGARQSPATDTDHGHSRGRGRGVGPRPPSSPAANTAKPDNPSPVTLSPRSSSPSPPSAGNVHRPPPRASRVTVSSVAPAAMVTTRTPQGRDRSAAGVIVPHREGRFTCPYRRFGRPESPEAGHPQAQRRRAGVDAQRQDHEMRGEGDRDRVGTDQRGKHHHVQKGVNRGVPATNRRLAHRAVSQSAACHVNQPDPAHVARRPPPPGVHEYPLEVVSHVRQEHRRPRLRAGIVEPPSFRVAGGERQGGAVAEVVGLNLVEFLRLLPAVAGDTGAPAEVVGLAADRLLPRPGSVRCEGGVGVGLLFGRPGAFRERTDVLDFAMRHHLGEGTGDATPGDHDPPGAPLLPPECIGSSQAKRGQRAGNGGNARKGSIRRGG
jgi:hypothetical protein